MEKKKTLISFVGKGRPKDNGEHEYKQTTYEFSDGTTYTCSCFAEAIRMSGKFSFDEILLVGTPTSTWSSLLENTDSEFKDTLFYTEVEEKELTPEQKNNLDILR